MIFEDLISVKQKASRILHLNSTHALALRIITPDSHSALPENVLLKSLDTLSDIEDSGSCRLVWLYTSPDQPH